jgi:hypothetical protein
MFFSKNERNRRRSTKYSLKFGKTLIHTMKARTFYTWILNIARNTSIDKCVPKFNNSQKNLSTDNFVNHFEGTNLTDGHHWVMSGL